MWVPGLEPWHCTMKWFSSMSVPLNVWLATHAESGDSWISFWLFWDRIKHSPGYLQTVYVAEADLERLILLLCLASSGVIDMCQHAGSDFFWHLLLLYFVPLFVDVGIHVGRFSDADSGLQCYNKPAFFYSMLLCWYVPHLQLVNILFQTLYSYQAVLWFFPPFF